MVGVFGETTRLRQLVAGRAHCLDVGEGSDSIEGWRKSGAGVVGKAD
jgi:hypothetical protein